MVSPPGPDIYKKNAAGAQRVFPGPAAHRYKRMQKQGEKTNMKNLTKRAVALLGAATLSLSLAACGSTAGTAASTAESTTAEPTAAAATAAPATAEEAPAEAAAGTPKYIFLFIGDGMSYPQIQSTNYYLSALENGTSMGGDGAILQHEDALSFVDFPVAGSAQTYDSTSFCPDSASTATSISTGHKTYSGTINMDETGTVAYETIAEQLKDQLGYKIGVISSVNLNHATPAAFYCHQVSRNDYYDIGLEMIESGFDYFAGGALLQPTGAEEDQADLYELAADAGYTVVKTQAEAEALTADAGPAVVISEQLADGDSIPYELDREEGTWALSDAVEEVIAFYNEHSDETLILVTGDHETGGLTIGYAGTNYDTFLQNLANQKISYAKYDTDYVAKYKEEGTPFEQVLVDVQELFGLTTEAAAGQAAEDGVVTDNADSHPSGVTSGSLVMTEYELGLLQDAYNMTMTKTDDTELTQEEYILYGSYEPLSVTITHILNNKSGIDFSSYSHTGLPVAVFAMGAGQELFEGYYDNTDIYFNLAELTGVA